MARSTMTCSEGTHQISDRLRLPPPTLFLTPCDGCGASPHRQPGRDNKAIVLTGDLKPQEQRTPSAPELLAFRAGRPEDQLPLGNDGRSNEDAPPRVAETATDLPSATTRQLSASLAPRRT